jgi:putative peptide zinc metalloprotease protein
VERDFIPKLIGGMGRWELFPGIFIIGSADFDRYIRVPAESVEPVWRAIQYCDGNRSLAQISQLVLAGSWNFDVAGLYRKLAGAGLVAGIEYVSDLDRVSVTWLELRIASLFPAWRCWKGVSWLLTALMLSSVLVGGAVWWVKPVSLGGVWNPAGLGLAVAVLSGTVISVLIHEAGHAVAACGEGLTARRVRLMGYLGVIPYTLLSIPGLYTIRPKGRLRVWFAGPLASLSLASISYLATGLESLPVAARVWFDHMSLANTMVAVWNCCPLLPTDGYFIVSTLLRQPNWRIRSWRELSNCVRQRRRPQVLLLLYALGSSAALALMVLHSIDRILHVTNFSWFGYAAVLLLILLFGYKRMALKRRAVAASLGGM